MAIHRVTSMDRVWGTLVPQRSAEIGSTLQPSHRQLNSADLERAARSFHGFPLSSLAFIPEARNGVRFAQVYQSRLA